MLDFNNFRDKLSEKYIQRKILEKNEVLVPKLGQNWSKMTKNEKNS